MTTMEVVEYLHTYPLQVYRLVRERKLSALKVGREYRFYKNEIDQFAHHDIRIIAGRAVSLRI